MGPACSLYILLVHLFWHGHSVQVTIYPKYLSQAGRVHYESDRWDGHNGLDSSGLIDNCKAIGTESGRWLNKDISVFPKAQQDPHRHGYPDPNHFTSDPNICSTYLNNINQYHLFSGSDSDIVMEIKGLFWPSWLDTSQHGGKFPNNLDAGAEFVILMLDAIKKCTHGRLPSYFEVMNEPDAAWPNLHWEQVIQFHKIVAKKIKAKFPGMKVGGPTKTGTVSTSNERNFRIWQMVEQFMNMSLDNLDFFSYHPYNSISVHGNKYNWAGSNEARFVAFMDMVENYAHIRKGRAVPLILSEYGLGRTEGIDAYHPSDWLDWAYITQHNAHMFTYQNYRGFIDRAIGFILAHEEHLGQKSLHYSLFHRNGTQKNAAMAYRFWRHLSYSYKYLRVESQFDKHDRMISPLALADPTKGKVSVLLHNYAFSSTSVNLHFLNNLVSTNGATSTCFYLDSHRKPVLSENVPLHMKNGNVDMHPDSSCIFNFNAHTNLNSLSTIHESTYYGHEMEIPIKRHCAICILSCQGCEDSVQTHINVDGTTSSMQYAKLRVSVSLEKQNGKFGNPTPTGVKVNNHSVTTYYRLLLSGRGHEDSLWDVYIYSVPTAFVKHGGNTIKLAFSQEQGHVSSVALVIGTN